MTDTELLNFCDDAFKRDTARRKGMYTDVAIGDISVMIRLSFPETTFREVIQRAVQQRVDLITKKLTR